MTGHRYTQFSENELLSELARSELVVTYRPWFFTSLCLKGFAKRVKDDMSGRARFQITKSGLQVFRSI